MQVTAKKEFYIVRDLENGDVDVVGEQAAKMPDSFQIIDHVREGEAFSVMPPWRKERFAWRLRVITGNVDEILVMHTCKVLRYCNEIEWVNEIQAAQMALYGTNETLDGYIVEPDGRSPEGWPSWPLLHGAI